MTIPEILSAIAATSSSNEKKRLLTKMKSNEITYILKQAYDPFIVFGTVNIDTTGLTYSTENIANATWFSKMSELLTNLVTRKLTGNAAREKIHEFLNASTAEWADIFLRILKKDLRIGVNSGIINKVYPGLLPEAFCMGAMKFDEKRIDFPVYADIKLDGIRCIATLGDETKLVSRNGKAFKNYSSIADEIKKLDFNDDYRIDGEITCGHFQNLMRTISRKEDGIELAKDAIYNIFDIQLVNCTFEKRQQYLERLRHIIAHKKLKHLRTVPGKIIQNMIELIAFYNETLSAGFEGIIVKSLNGIYEYRRSYSWMKMKPIETIDIKIISVEEGDGKYKNQLGAFICKLSNGSEVRVGSGLSDFDRKEYWMKQKQLIGKMIEVKYQELTKKSSLRFPIFKRFRQDKE